ncbi:MAG TPA: PhoH family protein, partial [Usitatibacter sp.]|nr:PhoH family protein [Usitatibacter sp.]
MTARRRATEEVAFRPVDNARLAALCGPVDANLRQIETALDVHISRHGERFAVSGPKEKAAQAATALRRFYDQAARDLTVEDIQLGLVEIAHPRRKQDVEAPALVIPRRTELTARTPRQAQYLQQMRSNDITFCVG